jgi:hypothetical protein
LNTYNDMVDFELIKGKLSQYTLSSILESSHDLLVAIDRANDKGYPIWNILVLMKWAFISCKNSVIRKIATIRDIEETVALINSFHDDIKPIDFKKGIKTGLKIIGFQQFWLQDHMDESVLFRSYVLFNVVKTTVDIDREFKTKSGIGTNEFLYCAYMMHLYFNRDKIDKEVEFDSILHDEDLDAIIHFVGKQTLNLFLDLIEFPAIEPQSLQRMTFEGYQLYETTLWNRYPLLRIRNQRVLVHRAATTSMIRNFIYDYLKKHSTPFRTEIGERMEKYIELGIQETNAKYLNETDLKSQFTLQKVCDFLIEDNVLVECKAIELSPTAGIKRTKSILQNEFDSNATKAYIQMLSAARKIGPAIQFGIVITYKETFIGYGTDAFEEFMKEPIEAFIKSQQINLSILPPERLVYITLEDWDRLIRLKKHTRQKLAEILNSGFKYFRENKVILFEQVLDKLCQGIKLPSLSYLEQARSVFA